MIEPETPYFLIRERDLLANLDKIDALRRISGTKVLLALKCFSTWGVFPILRGALDGTVASSPYEARLGAETFGGETQIYSPGYSQGDIREVEPFADKVVFNSISQWERFRQLLSPAVPVGMRVNPEVSYSRAPLADPARPGSRLGVRLEQWEAHGAIDVTGVMLHMNCDNDNFRAVSQILDVVSDRFEKVLEPMQWVSLGGGVLFTADGLSARAVRPPLSAVRRSSRRPAVPGARGSGRERDDGLGGDRTRCRGDGGRPFCRYCRCRCGGTSARHADVRRTGPGWRVMCQTDQRLHDQRPVVPGR